MTHFQINCAWLHQIGATVLSTFSLFGIPELPIKLNKGELVLQLCVEVLSSVLSKSDLLWLAINKGEINTEAIHGYRGLSCKQEKHNFAFILLGKGKTQYCLNFYVGCRIFGSLVPMQALDIVQQCPKIRF